MRPDDQALSVHTNPRDATNTYNVGQMKTEKKLFLAVWHRFANSNGCNKKGNG